MFHLCRILGDVSHALSILWFLGIAGIKGNGFGISLKSQKLFLMVFLIRYLDLVTVFYSWYNTCMKIFILTGTSLLVAILTSKEPARSTYSASADSFNHISLAIGAVLFGLIIHLVGSGVVEVKGASGQEFEVHFEHYSLLSFLWTVSICLEPLAMIPQLYIFRHNRLINRDVRFAIFLMFLYRLFYVVYWIYRAKQPEGYKHHYLLYFSGGLQSLLYIDFLVYNFSVAILWLLSKCGGDTMVIDSGIMGWSSKASINDSEEDIEMLLQESNDEEVWSPGDKPASNKVFNLKETPSGIGVV